MNKLWFLLYNIIGIPLQYITYSFARFFHTKVAEGIKGRRGQEQRLRDELSGINKERKRIMFHCASAGEWEQARPIIEALRKSDGSVYIIVMFFSSSGYNYVKDNSEVDLKLYMPFDSYFRAVKFFKTIKPELWVVVKHDIWPNHVFAANRLKIPMVLIDASLPPDSRRFAKRYRSFHFSIYKNFDYIFPVSQQDMDRFSAIFPYNNKMIVCGDTRYDQVYKRGMDAKNQKALDFFENMNSPVFIAGSIWPSDEKQLMPAVINLMKKYPDLNVILVPHEPDEQHLQDIENLLNEASISGKRFTEIRDDENGRSRVVIINTIGLLAKLYAQADIAYVGGSFGPGIHNVMEPAILSIPVLFGPRHLNSLEARQLLERGGGFSVLTSDDIERILSGFLENPEKRLSAGEKANTLIRENLGATDYIVKELREIYEFIPREKTG